ncbi:MAG: MBL fold metallo-hydrolase, partial [Deltaproteobacteria bacterium]|nr:MBL fold metallo-hydrolase [Deltaproteobacteria bacterium]
MTMRITTLAENTAGGDPENINWFFLAEYALSILVEVEGSTILFDTGLSTSAVHNARLLGIDLSSVDKIVLSHGHEDHTGGLREVLRLTGPVEVIAHPDIWQLKYARIGDKQRYVGIPFRRQELESWGASFNLSREPVWITDNIVTSGEVPMSTDYEIIDPALFVKEGGRLHPDPVADDLALIVKTGQGLVVILGCAHRGVVNT